MGVNVKQIVTLILCITAGSLSAETTFKSIRTQLQQKPIRANLAPVGWVVGLVPQVALEKAFNCLMLSYESIIKAATKNLLYLVVTDDQLAQVGPISISTYTLIDYGCEAGWTGFWDGPQAIPRVIARKLCVDVAYDEMSAGAHAFGLDYPSKIKSHKILLATARFATSLVLKELIGLAVDKATAIVLQNEESAEEIDSHADEFRNSCVA